MSNNVLLIILGFILLIKGTDIFVDGISSTSLNLKIPKIIISLKVVAFGTSAPELFISIQGLLDNSYDLVLANVIGSTIVNAALVIGVASLVRAINVKKEIVKKQLPLHFLMSLVFGILVLDSLFNGGNVNIVSRSDAIILFLIFIIFLIYIYKLNKKSPFNELIHEEPKWNMAKSIIYTILGLLGIFFGSQIAVDNCIEFAQALHISEKLITMLILVIGTSSPELIMGINASKKGEFDIILGNIIGTNLFNIGFVLGLPVIFFGNVYSSGFGFFDMMMMVASTLSLYFFARNDKKIQKKEGIALLIIFLVYYVYLFL